MTPRVARSTLGALSDTVEQGTTLLRVTQKAAGRSRRLRLPPATSPSLKCRHRCLIFAQQVSNQIHLWLYRSRTPSLGFRCPIRGFSAPSTPHMYPCPTNRSRHGEPNRQTLLLYCAMHQTSFHLVIASRVKISRYSLCIPLSAVPS